MLKNKIWIVALFVALTIGFIGCTDAAFDWIPPVEELDDNALQVFPKETWAGIELNHAKFNFAAGDIIVVTGKALAANTIHISNNHQGWNPIGATGEQRVALDEEFELKATLTKADVTSIAGLSPAVVRIYGRVANATFIIYNITVTRGGEEFFNFYEMILKDLKPGTTGAVAIFGEKGANTDPTLYRAEEWMGVADGESNSHDKAVYTILGPGYGGSAAEPTPEYKGKEVEGKVVFIKGVEDEDDPANSTVDTVIDKDPSITGANVTIDANGVISFNGAGLINYKFPAGYVTGSGKKAITNALDLEGDYDEFVVEYKVLSYENTAGTSKIEVLPLVYEGANDDFYPAPINDASGQYYQYVTLTENGSIGTIKMQTWGAGGKAGFSLRVNSYALPVADGGNASGGGAQRPRFNLQITKVTFTKGERVKVSFFTPQTPGINNIADVTIFKGNSLGSKLPAPKNPGWTFLGWYTLFDQATQNMVPITGIIPGAAVIGTRVIGTTAINSNTKLHALWFSNVALDKLQADPVFVAADATKTPTVTYDSKSWFLMINATSNTNWKLQDGDETDLVADEGNTIAAGFGGGGAIISYDFSALPSAPFDTTAYKSIRVTYDLVLLEGKTAGIAQRVGTTEGSANVGGYGLSLEAGEGKTFTTSVAAFTNKTWGFAAGYGGHGFIVRFTGFELLVD